MKKARITFLLWSLAALSTVVESRAAVWSPSDWTLSPYLTTRVGYDSNLFARAGSAADGFHELEPRLIYARRPSTTLFSIEASARAVTFFDWSEQNSIDPSLRIKYRYPDGESLLATREMDVAISRVSVANSDVGRRVRETELSFRWEETVPISPKTAIRARLSARRTSFDEDDLNMNERLDAGVALAFLRSEKLDFGAGYDISLGRSTPPDGTRDSIRRVENALTIRGRGEFAPNVSGRLYLGLANANYSGAQTRAELDVVGGGNIEWAIRERRRFTATADRGVYFSAEGDAVTSSSVGVELNQEFSRGISAMIGTKVVRSIYRRATVFRRDTSFPFRTAIDYRINRRLSAAFEGSWSKHTSDWDLYSHHRATFAVRGDYRF